MCQKPKPTSSIKCALDTKHVGATVGQKQDGLHVSNQCVLFSKQIVLSKSSILAPKNCIFQPLLLCTSFHTNSQRSQVGGWQAWLFM